MVALSMMASRPANSGGLAPAPGVKGFRVGSLERPKQALLKEFRAGYECIAGLPMYGGCPDLAPIAGASYGLI